MNKTLCTDYYSKICTDLNWNELNFTFYFISFTFVLICSLPCTCIAAFWQLFTINEYQLINKIFKTSAQHSTWQTIRLYWQSLYGINGHLSNNAICHLCKQVAHWSCPVWNWFSNQHRPQLAREIKARWLKSWVWDNDLPKISANLI